MKVVFLDIDGVLNHWTFFKEQKAMGVTPKGCITSDHIDPECVDRLNSLLTLSEAKVVVSSTWRILHTPESLQATLEEKGFEGEIIGFTTTNDLGCRGNQIAQWLVENWDLGIESFVILDDDADMENLSSYLVQTSLFEEGLKDQHVLRAFCLLEHSCNSDIENEEWYQVKEM